MVSTELKDTFLRLVRLGIGHTEVIDRYEGKSQVPGSCPVDWVALKALADAQGLSAVVLDSLDKCRSGITASTDMMPQMLRLEWIGEVLQNFEARYVAYEKAISTLAGFYRGHGIRMMVLKGYGLSLNWPNPKHRPCGDIDIWLFGAQKEADKRLSSCFRTQGSRLEIDSSHHHHTVFEWQGFTVENHYDFLNVHHHRSNTEMEKTLKKLGQDDSLFVDICGEKVYLPSANLHALFVLRHGMSCFASTGCILRQLLDWGFFVKAHGMEIDWVWLESQLEHFGMKRLYDIFNAILVGDLGFDARIFPKVQFDPSMKDRVLNDILSPEFSETEKGGVVRRAVFKCRRWGANAWKHDLCFSESLWSAFWSGVWSHLLKPSSI